MAELLCRPHMLTNARFFVSVCLLSYLSYLAVQVSEVLAKVVRQQAEVVDLAEKRAEVLSCIEEFEAVRAECRWLNEYEHDEMRYKVGQASTMH